MSSTEAAVPARFGGAGPIAAYLVLCFVWGSTYLAIRLAVAGIPPTIMVGTRSVLAGLVVVLFAVARGARLPPPRALFATAAIGIMLFVGGQTMLALAETRIQSGQAAVIGAMQALIMPLAAWGLAAAAAPGWPALMALLVGFCGVVILINPGHTAIDPLGAAAVLASVVSWSIGGAMARRWPTGHVILGSGLQMLTGGLAALALSVPIGAWHGFSWSAVPPRAVAGFAYLASVGSLVGFSAFAWLVQIWPPARLATYTYVNPIVALVLGALFAGEALTARDLAATGVILAAVGLVMAGARNKA